MEKDGTDYVYLSLENMGTEEILNRFPNIYRYCLDEGYNITKEPIPVVPAQHYFMGGVKVDLDGRTSMNRLYSAGETACNGVHGANRLASNSLLESLVWAKNAALHIAGKYEVVETEFLNREFGALKNNVLPDYNSVASEYHDSVREKIKNEHQKRQNQ